MRVKICGLTTLDTLSGAINAGAAYVGFVFYEKSPRHLSIEKASRMAKAVPEGICKLRWWLILLIMIWIYC